MQVYHNVLLSTILWYQIGGTAKVVLDVSSRDDVYEALEYIKTNQLSPVFVLGLGSNLLFPDEGFDGAIIRFLSQDDARGIQVLENDVIESFAGEFLDSVIHASFEAGLVGIEWAGGLPGTVGAAVRGNVGAFGGEIKDVFLKSHCILLKENGEYEEITLTQEEAKFEYRQSRIKRTRSTSSGQENMIVVSAQFQLKKGTPEELLYAREKYYENITYRQEKHPLDYPNCGSVFKNISEKNDVASVLKVWPDISELVATKWHGKVSMGYIIDRLGFKGRQIGQSQISEKHQNFIINRGGAKASDVKKIINEISEKMQEVFGFTPEVEIEIIS